MRQLGRAVGTTLFAAVASTVAVSGNAAPITVAYLCTDIGGGAPAFTGIYATPAKALSGLTRRPPAGWRLPHGWWQWTPVNASSSTGLSVGQYRNGPFTVTVNHVGVGRGTRYQVAQLEGPCTPMGPVHHPAP